MNDRLAGFCSGIGVAGLMVFVAMVGGHPWVLAVLASWSLILTPIVVADIIYDTWRSRRG